MEKNETGSGAFTVTIGNGTISNVAGPTVASEVVQRVTSAVAARIDARYEARGGWWPPVELFEDRSQAEDFIRMVLEEAAR